MKTGTKVKLKRKIEVEMLPESKADFRESLQSTHKTVQRCMYREYNEYPEGSFEIPSISGNTELRGIPDGVFRHPVFEEPIAFEVKTSKDDFKVSLYQCRTYRLDGFIPYVVIPGGKQGEISNNDEIVEVITLFNGNTPGLIKLGPTNIDVIDHPNYDV